MNDAGPEPPAFDITKIPAIMRTKSWLDGARLQDVWFAGAKNDDPAKGVPDTTTITMKWALSFQRAKAVYDEMLAGEIWMNPPAQQAIKKMLSEQGKLTSQKATFGDLTRSVVDVDKDYIQYRVVGSIFDPLDDMYAALGKFTFRMAISGTVVPQKSGAHTVVIHEVGTYVKDSFDFNGDQTLGFWSDTDVYRTPGFSTTQIHNSDYRKWRDAHGAGGDFYVFSDVLVKRLMPADLFDI